MDEQAIASFITESFPGVETVMASGGTFFFFDPEKMFPFATIMTNDDNDQASDLNRPGVYRLNIGISKESFRSRFDATQTHDYTALDTIMPHPVYGKMYWVCVLNPSEQTFNAVQPLLAEAYDICVRKQAAKSPSTAS